MTLFFLILVILVSVILGFIILVQNPKGGGLASSVGGFSNQFMGVKQTTDVLEKGTWLFAAIIGILCLVSTMFMGGSASTNSVFDKVGGGSSAPTQQTAPPAQTTPPPAQPTTPGQ
jgi:preprotein translocase subunit SecG